LQSFAGFLTPLRARENVISRWIVGISRTQKAYGIAKPANTNKPCMAKLVGEFASGEEGKFSGYDQATP
jgi:hypothetical protein